MGFEWVGWKSCLCKDNKYLFGRRIKFRKKYAWLRSNMAFDSIRPHFLSITTYSQHLTRWDVVENTACKNDIAFLFNTDGECRPLEESMVSSTIVFINSLSSSLARRIDSTSSTIEIDCTSFASVGDDEVEERQHKNTASRRASCSNPDMPPFFIAQWHTEIAICSMASSRL